MSSSLKEKQSSNNLIVNTIPVPKMTALINDFIVNTTNHLNK